MTVQAEAIVVQETLPSIYRAALLNLGFGMSVALITAFALKGFSLGFMAGYMLGFFNLIWLFRIVKKSTSLAPEKVMGFVSRRYFARFIITAAVIFFMIASGVFTTPWPAMVGITLSVLTSTASLVFITKEEFK